MQKKRYVLFGDWNMLLFLHLFARAALPMMAAAFSRGSKEKDFRF